ncbi:hypothetical protein HD806DRAFT_520241 [Xylariaceae sp. AK1471]|nr:hypothetical protein HD806DRAFT_520241 [Xylariaceae sp. AK1471]
MTSKVNASSQALLFVKSSSWTLAGYSQRVPREELSELYLAAAFGLYKAVGSLMDNHTINARDSIGKIRLSCSIDNEHVDVVELLLENGVERDTMLWCDYFSKNVLGLTQRISKVIRCYRTPLIKKTRPDITASGEGHLLMDGSKMVLVDHLFWMVKRGLNEI